MKIKASQLRLIQGDSSHNLEPLPRTAGIVLLQHGIGLVLAL